MMVYSSTAYIGQQALGDPAYFFRRQLTNLGLGLLLAVVVTWLPHRFWMKVSIPIMLLALAALFAVVITAQGGRMLAGRSIAPSEPAKLAVIIYIAHWLASKGDLIRRLPYGLLPFTIIVGLVAGLVIKQHDTSEAAVIVLASATMFFLAGADVIQLLIGAAGGIGAFALILTQIAPHLGLARIETFVASWGAPLTQGEWQLRQGLIALGSGGLLGVGPGKGAMKYYWLPTPHNDSIFAIIGEELGLIGCLVLLCLYAVIAYRGFRIASLAPDSFGRLLATGVTCWITFQALINMAVVTGIIPITGTTLPFISAGGSSLVSCLTGVGVLLSISRVTVAQKSSFDVRRSKRNQYQGSNLEEGALP
jgi:cell division protein FtsW